LGAAIPKLPAVPHLPLAARNTKTVSVAVLADILVKVSVVTNEFLPPSSYFFNHFNRLSNISHHAPYSTQVVTVTDTNHNIITAINVFSCPSVSTK
jgi:hypothetical protein